MEPDVIQTSPLTNAEGDFSRNIIYVRITDQIKELQTVLRDRFVPFCGGVCFSKDFGVSAEET